MRKLCASLVFEIVPLETAARADLRNVDRETAMRILLAITRYGETEEGDVKPLTDRVGLYRLRVGKWRIIFDVVARLEACYLRTIAPLAGESGGNFVLRLTFENLF